MAIIGSIRERSGLLLVIIGGAMAAFILTDLFSGRGSGRQDQVLGTVGDEEISAMEYERRVNDEIESYRNDFGQQVNAQMTEQVRNSVWQEVLKEKVMLTQVEGAGFSLTKGEYDDIRFGQNILPEFKNQPNFQGEDGQPSTEKLQQYFSSVQLNAPVYHELQKRRITENRLYAKYTNLVKKSVFVNSAQAKDDYLAKNTKATFNFVAKRYDSEPDSLYTVDDQSLRRYYDQHKGDRKYKQLASRKFEYVTLPVTASDADRQATMDELDQLRVAFENSSNDSLFVSGNSESRTYNKAPYLEGTADAQNDSLIANGAVGTVVGPFQEGEQWKLVKVEELADVPEARVRHILLSTQNGKTEEEQKAKADSILAVVKRDPSKFEDLVVKFSEDPGSNTKEKGGVYDWFDKQKMVPEFTAASFDEKVGAITVAKTDYGFHIVEVLGQRSRQERRVASIERTMKPSPATFKEVYKKANDFSLRNTDLDLFKKSGEELGLQVTPVDELRSDSRFVPGLQDANSLVSWVNRAEVGKVSEPIQSGDSYVVAILTGIREAGAPQLEDVREVFTKEVVKQKKAEAWVAKMQGKTDLNALATELGGSVQSATEMSYNGFSIPGGYSEYEVVGKIFGLESSQTSVPLTGETAVYVASMTNKTAAPEPEDLNIDKASLVQRAQSRVDGGLFNAMKEAIGVTDERSKYY
ncbi:MAG: peptidylprolyl isomerase [Flavobacteriales bacterium]|jgi:peptidyl-prolyl cis-trans isomerase D|nr:peptidylprolyl isomerase [Flavobacteriales bacterium]MBK6884836.1 peptidylprolyl isomerase [Flavobacteriales bacterium]MBK7102161.1 peptidylprolyl isomerase [Flavobacteriales bacterium]MBK7620466.1 peptidylprolyl isomerase [Flavobacteriales bacterium]MBK8531447.1 peptidylprolyl isomerase [Flavobacteriales bacterium]